MHLNDILDYMSYPNWFIGICWAFASQLPITSPSNPSGGLLHPGAGPRHLAQRRALHGAPWHLRAQRGGQQQLQHLLEGGELVWEIDGKWWEIDGTLLEIGGTNQHFHSKKTINNHQQLRK